MLRRVVCPLSVYEKDDKKQCDNDTNEKSGPELSGLQAINIVMNSYTKFSPVTFAISLNSTSINIIFS